jgi:hypothetical protein
MRNATVAALLAAALAATWITGCGDRHSESENAASQSATSPQVPAPPPPLPAPSASPAKSQNAAGSAATATPESVLIAWRSGDQAAAVARFVQVDWTAHPLFATDSVLGLSESQFRAIPEPSHRAKLEELSSQVAVLKEIARAVAAAGRDAAAKRDIANAEKDFTSLKQCGEALSAPDLTDLVRGTGNAMKRMADAK